ncbi:MAG: hypothetical protein OXF08_05880 [Bacteroidetes bacterium]|nr:hypothetical protein [Bacteroidota bacterium]
MKFRDIFKYFNPFRGDENSDSQSDEYIFSRNLSNTYIFSRFLEDISDDSEIGTEALIKQGEINGRIDMPPKELEGFDVTELKVIKAYERLIDAQTKGYRRAQQLLISKLKSLNPRLFPSNLNSDRSSEDDPSILVDQARSDMESAIIEKKNDIENKKTRACDAEKEYQTFKEENLLNHDLDLPHTILAKAKPWGWLILILVCESVLNGWFFGLQYGGSNYLLFVGEALLISGVNVLILGSVIRSSWKYLYHVQTHLKVWGIIGLIAFSVIALIFNLGAAHLRDAISPNYPDSGECMYQDFDAHSQEALCLLFNEKAKLAEFEAYAFFFLGLGCIVFGIFKWRNIFPGYPEHAKKQRQFQDAKNQLEKGCKSLYADLDKIYKDARRKLICSTTLEDHQSILNLLKETEENGDDRSNMEKFMPSIIEDYQLASRLLRNIQDKYKDYRGNIDEVSHCCQRALDFYRKANRLAREDVQNVPSTWDHKWTPDWSLSEEPCDLGLCSPEYAKALYDKELRYIEGQLDPSYRNALEKVDSLTKCTETKSDVASAPDEVH